MKNLSQLVVGLNLLVLAFGLSACQPEIKLPLLGRAPAWKFQDLDGKEVSAAQLQGKVVMVDFWATWCVPCVGEIPAHIELQKKYARDGLVIIGVSLDETGVDGVRKFAKEKGINYQVAMAKLDEVEALFGPMQGIPTKILIDRTGEIRDRQVGTELAAEYEKKVRAALK